MYVRIWQKCAAVGKDPSPAAYKHIIFIELLQVSIATAAFPIMRKRTKYTTYNSATIIAFPCPFLAKSHPCLFIHFAYVLAYVQAKT